MKEAYKEALEAEAKNEVPVGAVIVINNTIIARAHNMTETLNDVTAHAEMIAITSAANYLGSKYLTDCKIYVTLEPCLMCASALTWAQISELIYSADDTKKGYTTYNFPILHPKTKVKKGIMSMDSQEILKKFFLKKRKYAK